MPTERKENQSIVQTDRKTGGKYTNMSLAKSGKNSVQVH